MFMGVRRFLMTLSTLLTDSVEFCVAESATEALTDKTCFHNDNENEYLP